MTVEEAIQKYVDKFGGFPYFLFMGAPDEMIIEAVTHALETETEIECDNEIFTQVTPDEGTIVDNPDSSEDESGTNNVIF